MNNEYFSMLYGQPSESDTIVSDWRTMVGNIAGALEQQSPMYGLNNMAPMPMQQPMPMQMQQPYADPLMQPIQGQLAQLAQQQQQIPNSVS